MKHHNLDIKHVKTMWQSGEGEMHRQKQIWDRKDRPFPETIEEVERELKLQEFQEKEKLSSPPSPERT